MPYGKKKHSKKRRTPRVQGDDENYTQQEPARSPAPDIRDNMTRDELYDVCHHRNSKMMADSSLIHYTIQVVQHEQRRLNEAHAGNNELRRQLANVSNQRTGKRKRRLTEDFHDSENDEESEEEEEKSAKFKRVESLGRKHTIMMTLWVDNDRKIFSTLPNDSYNPLERFENVDNKKQGQLRDLLCTLPTEYHEAAFEKEWITHAVSINALCSCRALTPPVSRRNVAAKVEYSNSSSQTCRGQYFSM
jgi:hypothetical protein